MENPKETPQPMNEPRAQKRLIVSAIVAVVVLLIIGGIYALMKNKDVSYQPQINPNMVDSERTAEELNKMTESWKTYKNDSYGFEFKYPSFFDTRIEQHPAPWEHDTNQWLIEVSLPVISEQTLNDLKKSYGNNIGSSVFTVTVFDDSGVCSLVNGVVVVNNQKKKIGGIDFEYSSGGGTSDTNEDSISYSQQYRTTRGGKCYRIIASHSYLQSKGDSEVTLKLLDSIVESFRFTNTSVTRSNTYSDQATGLVMNYTSDWTSVTPTPSKNEFIPFELKHSSGCTLRLGTLDPDSLLFHQQNPNDTLDATIEAPVTDIYVSNRHFSMTSLLRRSHSAGYPAQTFAMYIHHFPAPNVAYTLAVTNNYKPLSDDCISSFVNLLKDNTQLAGGLYTLNKSSNGILQLKVSHYSSGDEPQWEKTKIALVFKPNQNSGVDEERVVTYLDLYSPQPETQLVNDLLYFVDATGQIGILDLVSKKVSMLSIPVIKPVSRYSPQSVNDIFVYKNTLYYLLGKNCLDYRAKCDLGLHAYDLTTKQDMLLASGVTSREIMGVDSASNKLYVRYSDGDAGCSWQTIQAYDFVSKSLSSVVSDSHCSDEVEKPTHQIVTTIENATAKQRTRLNAILVKNGSIVEDQSSAGTAYGDIRYIAK